MGKHSDGRGSNHWKQNDGHKQDRTACAWSEGKYASLPIRVRSQKRAYEQLVGHQSPSLKNGVSAVTVQAHVSSESNGGQDVHSKLYLYQWAASQREHTIYGIHFIRPAGETPPICKLFAPINSVTFFRLSKWRLKFLESKPELCCVS